MSNKLKRSLNDSNMSSSGNKGKTTPLKEFMQQPSQQREAIPPPGSQPPAQLLENDEQQVSPKKQKLAKTYIKSFNAGEMNQEITVKIVFLEFRQLQSSPMYIVHATDGVDLFQVEAQGTTLLKFMTDFGTDKLNAICHFNEIAVFNAKAEFNYGTVDVSLRIRENTKYTMMPICDDQELLQINAEEFFMAKLRNKFALADSSIVEKALKCFKDISTGTRDAFIQCQLDSIRESRTIKNQNYNFDSVVQDFTISQHSDKGRLSAWNIEAWFLKRFLKDAMGRQVIMSNLRFRSDNYGHQFTFGRQSRIKLLELEPLDQAAIENAPQTLEKLVKVPSFSGQTHMNIPMCLLEKPVLYNQGQHMAIGTDATHKAQCFFPVSFKWTKGTDFTVVCAEVVHLDSGVLNITMNNEANCRNVHIKPDDFAGELPNKKSLPYPAKVAKKV